MAKGRTVSAQVSASIIASALGADGAVLKQIQLLSMGVSVPRNGKPAKIIVEDLAHAEAIVAASVAYAGATEPVIDYDHQTVFAANAQVGGRAPAAGWMKRLYAQADGVWAEVEWTEAAATALAAREYRYISPFFHAEKATGRVTRIINAGLTNTPNLELAHVASALSTEEDVDTMNLSKIAEALGLPAEATEEEILGMISDWKTAKATMSSTASALGLTADANADAITAAVATALSAAKKPDPAQFVPISDLKALQVQVGKIADDRITASVDQAVKAGKLLPAQRDWALNLGKKDEAELEAYLATAQAIIRPGTEDPRKVDPKTGLTADEAVTASAWGLTEEQWLAGKAKEESE